MLSSILSVVVVVVRTESLIFGMALSLSEEEVTVSFSALCVCPGRHPGRAGEGVRERSELVGQQSGPVDIGSGEDGDEDADSDLGGSC